MLHKKVNTYLVTNLIYFHGNINKEITEHKSLSRKSLKIELMKISGYFYRKRSSKTTWKSLRKKGYYVSRPITESLL